MSDDGILSTDEQLRAEARKRLKARNDFWTLLAIFGAVSLLLVVVWFLSSGWNSYFWPIWPILGMSIAALFVGLDAFGVTRRHITESDIDAEVARMTRRSTPPS